VSLSITAKFPFFSITRQYLPSGFSAKLATKLYIFMGLPRKNPQYQYYKPKLIGPLRVIGHSKADILF
jgi:hypothetical protein